MTDRIRFIRPTGAFRRVLSAAAGFLAAAAMIDWLNGYIGPDASPPKIDSPTLEGGGL